MQTRIAYGKSDMTGHRLQQPKTVIGEELRFTVGQHDRSAHFPADTQRSSNQRL
ncbi:hypothetical protein D3C79_1031200 [compost metagenome]